MTTYWQRGVLLGVVSLMGLLHGGTAQAAAVTPAWGHWHATELTYHCDVQSPYYRRVWRQAVRNWNRTGVVHLRAIPTERPANITLTTAPMIGRPAQRLAGYTDYAFYRRPTGKLIIDAQARLNRRVLTTYHYTQRQRTSVATHELGHALGLDHSRSAKSIMYATNRNGVITGQDKRAIVTAYRSGY